ncbi:undecaprenyl diphosphate synthase family protein [Actinomadura sp. NPDC047616]|uniref:undecaprenyl diphosphate synthase family protein n=1 Tax=Actinomadura sp. NPDC047616 TaxID=3155914 RepID=UPI0033C00A58
MTEPPAGHVACIMDGGPPWPRDVEIDRLHVQPAVETGFAAAVDAAIEAGVRWLTLLPAPGSGGSEETAWKVLEPVLDANAEHLHGHGVRVGLLGGEESTLTDDVAHRLRRVRELTAGNTGLRLTLALTHDGGEALPAAVRALIAGSGSGSQRAGDAATGGISVGALAERLWQDTGLPEVDMLIRTGGRHRLSGALPWHCADAELVFLDVPWADFTAEHFRQALELYRLRRALDEPQPPDEAITPTVDTALARSSAASLLGAAVKATGLLRSSAVAVPARVPGLGRLPAGAGVLVTLPAEVAGRLMGDLCDTARFATSRLTGILLDHVADTAAERDAVLADASESERWNEGANVPGPGFDRGES